VIGACFVVGTAETVSACGAVSVSYHEQSRHGISDMVVLRVLYK